MVTNVHAYLQWVYFLIILLYFEITPGYIGVAAAVIHGTIEAESLIEEPKLLVASLLCRSLRHVFNYPQTTFLSDSAKMPAILETI